MKTNTSACDLYEKNFNNKIDKLKNHSNYTWLRQYADEAIRFHTGFGYLAIKAQDFMDKIIQMPLNDIEKWLNKKSNI